jgi:hypothetical protein
MRLNCGAVHLWNVGVIPLCLTGSMKYCKCFLEVDTSLDHVPLNNVLNVLEILSRSKRILREHT